MPKPFDPKEVLRSTNIKPFPYQELAVRSAVKEFRNGIDSTMVTMPTGTGKSFVMAWTSKWAISKGMRALVLAHSRGLVQQNASSHIDLGIPCKIEMADLYAREDDTWMTGVFGEEACPGEPVCVSASTATLKGARLESWPRDYFGLICTDEFHHAVNDGFTDIYRHFDKAKRLGVTATPDRLDGQDLGKIAQTIAYQYPMRDAIKEGWLCRPRFIRCKVAIDLRKFTKRKLKDYSDSDIAETIKPHIQVIANAIKGEIGDRPTLVFCPDVLTSEMAADALFSLGLKAQAVSGGTKNQDEIIGAFKAGEFQVLCNCALLTEGRDFPSCSAVVSLRPTKSRGLASQIWGRGLRKGKPDVLLIDMTWVTAEDADSGLPDPDSLLVTPSELFDTYTSPSEVQAIAKEILESGETDDVLEAVERAEKEYDERVRVRIKVREQKVRYERIVYDPFAVMDSLGIPAREESPSSQRVMATPGQVATLNKFAVQGAEHMSKRRAKVMLDAIFKRMDEKKATFKMVSRMISNGIDPEVAREMSFEEASAYFDQRRGKVKTG